MPARSFKPMQHELHSRKTQTPQPTGEVAGNGPRSLFATGQRRGRTVAYAGVFAVATTAGVGTIAYSNGLQGPPTGGDFSKGAKAVATNAGVKLASDAVMEAFDNEAPPALPGLQIVVDGRPVAVRGAVRGAEGPMLPVAEAVTVLSSGQARLGPCRPTDRTAPVLSIKRGAGTPLFTVPIAGEANTEAMGKEPATREPEPAVWIGQGKNARLYMSAWGIAGRLGASVVESEDGLYFTTQAAWCTALGLPKNSEGLQGRTLVEQMGAAPPARTVLLWVRPSQKAYVQLFWLGAGNAASFASERKPAPLLGQDIVGDLTQLLPGMNGTASPWVADGQKPVRFLAEFWETEPSLAHALGGDGPQARWASYVAVVTTRSVPNGDVLGAIRSGALAPGEWTVAGLRQRIGRHFVQYEPVTIASGQTLEQVCLEKRAAPSLVRDINGLRPDEMVHPGTQLLIPAGEDAPATQAVQAQATQNLSPEPPKTQTQTASPVAHKPVVVAFDPKAGLQALVKKHRASLNQTRQVNNLAPGEEPQEGEPITLAGEKAEGAPIPPAPRDELKADFRQAVLKQAVSLYKNDEDAGQAVKLPAGGRLQVTFTNFAINRSRVQVLVGGKTLVGYVRTGALGEDDKRAFAPWQLPPPVPASAPLVPSNLAAARLPAPPAFLPPNAPAGVRVAQEALRWVGVPRYVWGGNDIARGIDCSHFVAQAHARAGVPCPSAPVHEMERYGDIVTWRPGIAEDWGKQRMFPTARDLGYLRPGDRIIFQAHPERQFDGNHHVGIYIGPNYRGIPFAVVHCNSSKKTVSIDSLTSGYLNRIFRYAVRGSRLRQYGQYVAQTNQAGERSAERVAIAGQPPKEQAQ